MAATSYRYLVNLPGVCQGKTIVEGTRIGVHDVVGLILNGASVDDVCRSFPDLSRAQVYECLAYYEDHRTLLDHDVPAEIGHLLRYWEHTVTVLRTVLPVTASDEKVFGHACSQGLVLISCNRDHFLTLARQTQDHPGLIILIRRRTRHSECAHLSVLLQRAGEKGLRNNVNFA